VIKKEGEMLFMVGVVKDVREAMKGEIHGKFQGVGVITIEMIAEMNEVVVAKEIKLFSLRSLPELEWC
jgi:hypothetical protein